LAFSRLLIIFTSMRKPSSITKAFGLLNS
jgi:hypothetical protein